MKLLTYKYGYVYKTTNLINGKIYIGRHRSSNYDPYYKGSGTRLWMSIKEYGFENFSVKILKWCSTREELDRTEVQYIKSYNSTNPLIGYNLGTTEYSIAKYGLGCYEPQNKGKVCYHDENRNYYFPKDATVPSHLIKGRRPLGYKRKSPTGRDFFGINKGRVGYTNGERMIFIKPGDPIPDGYTRGQTPDKVPISNHRKGKTSYTNGVISRFFSKDDIIPEGFYKGTLYHRKSK